MSGPNAGMLLIDGEWRSGGGAAFAAVNPSTSCEGWRGNAANGHDVNLAIAAARKAFAVWAMRPFESREAIVRAFAAALQRHSEALAHTIGSETGKPLWESRTEVATMVGKIDLSVRAYHQRTGSSESRTGALTTVTRHRPHGVVAVFGPYNFPGHLPNGHIVPALLAGNCVIFKPSELTPATAEMTATIWQEAGLPTGVLGLLQGERETGERLAAHDGLDGLYFTGSVRTGQILARQFAATPQRILALELGGNNPLILGEVADLRAAVYDTLQSAFLSAGQRCTCARRLFVPRGARGDAFLDRLVTATAKISVGAFDDDPQPFMGPLVSAKAAQGLIDAQERLLALGGRSLLELQRLPRGPAYLSPGIVDGTQIAALPDDEYFGPLLTVIRTSSLEEAVRRANDTRFGLSAALLSDSRADYDYFYPRIRAGIVNWNRQTTGASGGAPFGGVGASGNHRPAAFYAADYCAYPVASVESERCALPAELPPGIALD